MIRAIQPRGRGNIAQGYGKRIKIHDDLRSALIHEVVEQINESTASAQASLADVADAATKRGAIFSSRYLTEIKRIRLINPNADLVGANTDIRIGYVSNGNWNPLAPVSPTVIFHAEGFDGGALPGQSSIDLQEIQAGVNTTALTKAFRKFVLPKNAILFIELINNEGAARSLDVMIEYANMDRLELQPRDLSKRVLLSPRNFFRGPRRI